MVLGGGGNVLLGGVVYFSYHDSVCVHACAADVFVWLTVCYKEKITHMVWYLKEVQLLRTKTHVVNKYEVHVLKPLSTLQHYCHQHSSHPACPLLLLLSCSKSFGTFLQQQEQARVRDEAAALNSAAQQLVDLSLHLEGTSKAIEEDSVRLLVGASACTYCLSSLG